MLLKIPMKLVTFWEMDILLRKHVRQYPISCASVTDKELGIEWPICVEEQISGGTSRPVIAASLPQGLPQIVRIATT